MTTNRERVFNLLRDKGPLTVTDILEYEDIRRNWVQILLYRAVQAGLATRVKAKNGDTGRLMYVYSWVKGADINAPGLFQNDSSRQPARMTAPAESSLAFLKEHHQEASFKAKTEAEAIQHLRAVRWLESLSPGRP